MTRKSSKLTPRQRAAVKALMETRSIPDAAAIVGISQRSMYRWLASPIFRAELAQAEGLAIDTAERNLVRMVDGAMDIIRDVMADMEIPPGVRLRASQMVLDNLIRLRELQTMEERLSRLENMILQKELI